MATVKKNAVVFRSTMNFRQCYARLGALAKRYKCPSIFTSKEISFAAVDVQPQQDHFVVQKRKSYINPWAPQLELYLIDESGGMSIVGHLRQAADLKRVVYLNYTLIVVGVGALFCTLRNLITHKVPDSWEIPLVVGATELTLVLIAAIVFSKYCAWHYQQMAKGEERFLISAVERTLKAHSLQGLIPNK